MGGACHKQKYNARKQQPSKPNFVKIINVTDIPFKEV